MLSTNSIRDTRVAIDVADARDHHASHYQRAQLPVHNSALVNELLQVPMMGKRPACNCHQDTCDTCKNSRMVDTVIRYIPVVSPAAPFRIPLNLTRPITEAANHEFATPRHIPAPEIRNTVAGNSRGQSYRVWIAQGMPPHPIFAPIAWHKWAYDSHHVRVSAAALAMTPKPLGCRA